MNMLAIALGFNRTLLRQILPITLGMIGWLSLSSCQTPAVFPPRVVHLEQTWELAPGDQIAGHLVVGSLGDVSIQLGGDRLYAPFAGKVEPATQPHCVIYSTPEVPAYLFRFCGLNRPTLGKIDPGQSIGSGDYLQFATMRRQPDGTWTIVEPSTGILERAIDPTGHHNTARQP